ASPIFTCGIFICFRQNLKESAAAVQTFQKYRSDNVRPWRSRFGAGTPPLASGIRRLTELGDVRDHFSGQIPAKAIAACLDPTIDADCPNLIGPMNEQIWGRSKIAVLPDPL